MMLFERILRDVILYSIIWILRTRAELRGDSKVYHTASIIRIICPCKIQITPPYTQILYRKTWVNIVFLFLR